MFSVAGTVFAVQGQKAPAAGVDVHIEDSAGTHANVTTNAAGNFYITPSQWSPTFPTGVISITQGQIIQVMLSHVGRDGSCAACHVDPASTTSPGPLWLMAATAVGAPDGGP